MNPSDLICSRCCMALDRKGRYCRECHNAYMREWRIGRVLSDEEKQKQNCRSKTKYLLKTGKLAKGTCEICGTAYKAEGHHPDYDNPALVVWLCRLHHKDHHKERHYV